MSNQEEDNVQELLAKLELAIRTQVEKSMSVTDVKVSTQRSRFYKFWCYAIYGHLLGPAGVCLRCGKKITSSINVPKTQTK
jgi:hypothetical protein